MRTYLTELGHKGSGHTTNRTRRECLRYIHDILLDSERNRLNVSVLCGSLRQDQRDTLFKSETGFSYADCVRGVLRAGGNVRILIWNEDRDGVISPGMTDLLSESQRNDAEYPGKLDIRLSGTAERSQEVCHFTVAKGRVTVPEERDRWLVRVEKPHPAYRLDEPVDDESEVHAAVIFNEEAEQEARPLLKAFDQLFDAAGSSSATQVSLNS